MGSANISPHLRHPYVNPAALQMPPMRAKFTHYFHQQTPPVKTEQVSPEGSIEKVVDDNESSVVKSEFEEQNENLTADATDRSSEVRVF